MTLTLLPDRVVLRDRMSLFRHYLGRDSRMREDLRYISVTVFTVTGKITVERHTLGVGHFFTTFTGEDRLSALRRLYGLLRGGGSRGAWVLCSGAGFVRFILWQGVPRGMV